MKKYIVIILVFLLGFALGVEAQADTLATLKNRAGGVMYFSDAQCPGKDQYWKVIYSTLSGGQTIWGCWFYADGMVHVKWDSGQTSAFKASDLTINYNKGT